MVGVENGVTWPMVGVGRGGGTPKIDRATRPFLKFDRATGAFLKFDR